MKLKIVTLSIAICILSSIAHANPTNTGVSGLIHVPSAETLDAGNICLGLWSDVSTTGEIRSTTMPISATFGVGSFWELYGSYPNVLLNNEEYSSGRGTVDFGSKMRIWGKRNSPFRIAADLSGQMLVAEDPALDGMIDIGTRLIASLKSDRFGFHLYGGYTFVDTAPGFSRDDAPVYGGGVEYAPFTRLKLLAEVFKRTSLATPTLNDNPLETSVGLQFYLTPHLTFNAAGGAGFGNSSQDWRVVVGFSTCQGIGSYIKPVPSLAPKGSEETRKKQQLARPVKIKPITPLLLKSAPVASISRLEVPVDSDVEEIIIKPYGQIVIPSQQTINPVALHPKFVPSRPQQTQLGTKVAKVQLQQAAAAVPVAKVASETLQPVKLPQEVSPEELGNEVTMVPEGGKPDYTLDLVEGVTPLYALEVKGEKPRLLALQPVAAQPVPAQPVATQPVPIPEKMVVYRKFRFVDGKFEFNMSNLSDEVKKSIAEAAEQIRNDKNWVYLRIDGHTDGMGSLDYNMDLSLKRAIAVASQLITKEGIDPGRVFVKGMGKTKHIADNSTAEGRRLNRRFEILFLVPKEK